MFFPYFGKWNFLAPSLKNLQLLLKKNYFRREFQSLRNRMLNKKTDRQKNNTKYSSTSKIVKYIPLDFSVSTILSFKSIEMTNEVKVS